MFVFKKILSAFLMPVPVVAAILIIGVVCLWIRRRESMGKILVTVGALLMMLLGYGPVSDNLLRTLEYKYHPFVEKKEGIKWVVVLGGGSSCDEGMPPGDRLSPPSLFRLVEGVRLFREHPGSKLLLSGGAMFSTKDAETMATVARVIGVPEEDIVLEAESLDTEDEARLIKSIVQDAPFILVTSAAHMPRAMTLFEIQGMHPSAAPAEYRIGSRECERLAPELPMVTGLQNATVAFHEYLGLFWLKLKGAM